MTDSREYEFEGTTPTVAESANVARDATLVGDVRVGPDASVWPGVVLRGDIDPVIVGGESHVGDNAVLHAARLGERVMVGHGAVLNETTVGDGSMVGFNSTVSDTHIGHGSIVAVGTVVPEGLDIPAESFARGAPAKVTPLSETTFDVEEAFEAYSSGDYSDLANRHTDLFE
jgi:carbonic anhydrase/acetyltransferase-like protein (isoleucine patch superfamily)